MLALVYYLNPFVYIAGEVKYKEDWKIHLFFNKALPEDLHLMYHLFVFGWGEGYMLGL